MIIRNRLPSDRDVVGPRRCCRDAAVVIPPLEDAGRRARRPVACARHRHAHQRAVWRRGRRVPGRFAPTAAACRRWWTPAIGRCSCPETAARTPRTGPTRSTRRPATGRRAKPRRFVRRTASAPAARSSGPFPASTSSRRWRWSARPARTRVACRRARRPKGVRSRWRCSSAARPRSFRQRPARRCCWWRCRPSARRRQSAARRASTPVTDRRPDRM